MQEDLSTPYTVLALLLLVLVSSLVVSGCDNVRPWGYGRSGYGVGGLGVRVPLNGPHSKSELTKDDSLPGKVFVGQVISVPDGDTLTVSINGQNVQVHLIGVAAPELDQAPWGAQAHEALTSLVTGKPVQLKTDITERDQLGRLLAYVFVEDTFVNLELVRQGRALLDTRPPNIAHVEEYQQAQEDAQRAGRGVWDRTHPLTVSPDCYRKQQNGQVCELRHGRADSIRQDFLP